MTEFYSKLSDAFLSIENWFIDITFATNTFWIVIGVLSVVIISRFLLLPFFRGVISTGVSDSVNRVTGSGKYSEGYKNQQKFYKSK